MSSGQSDLGTLSVQGLFVVSGFLVAGSTLRSSVRRYAWHRVLRIFPGFWVCLLVTALVIAPLVAWYENGNLNGFWSHPTGPFDYLRTNWFASMDQFPISGLLADTPYGRAVGGPSAFDGSLWSLRYGFVCYVLVGVVAAVAVLRFAPRVVLLLLGAGYVLIIRDLLTASSWTIRPPARGVVGPFPFIGTLAAHWMLYLTFLFLLGAAARLYMHRLPMHGALAALAGAVVVGSLWWGAFIVVGLPAYAYLLLYAAVALPDAVKRFSEGRDYSYGVYLYAFPVQQVIALVGGSGYGLPTYLLFSVAGTMMLAAFSWHLVERPALRLKSSAWPTTYRPRHHSHRAEPGQRPTPGLGVGPGRKGVRPRRRIDQSGAGRVRPAHRAADRG